MTVKQICRFIRFDHITAKSALAREARLNSPRAPVTPQLPECRSLFFKAHNPHTSSPRLAATQLQIDEIQFGPNYPWRFTSLSFRTSSLQIGNLIVHDIRGSDSAALAVSRGLSQEPYSGHGMPLTAWKLPVTVTLEPLKGSYPSHRNVPAAVKFLTFTDVSVSVPFLRSEFHVKPSSLMSSAAHCSAGGLVRNVPSASV